MYKNFTGFESFLIDGNLIDEFHQQEKIPISSLQLDQELYPNTYIELKSLFNPKHTSIGKVSNQYIVKIKESKVYGIKPRNREQIFALDALLDDNVPVVVLTGKSGVGKTLMMTAVAVDKRLRKKYKKVVLSKPMSQVGEFEIGVLPGYASE